MRTNSRRAGAYVCAIAVAVLWGLSFVAMKEAFGGGLTTFSIISVRLTVAALCLLLLACARGKSLAVRVRDLLGLALTGILGITLYSFFELRGLECTSPSVASLIIATIPIFSLLAGVVLYRKETSAVTWLGVLTSLFGVYLLSFTEVGENSAAGFAYLFGACLCWVIYLEITDRLLRRYSNLAVTFWQTFFALISVLPLALRENVAWGAVSLKAWLWTGGFLGIVCSTLCYIMNNFSIAVLSPQMNSVFLNLSPVSTAVGSYFILGEIITPSQCAGGVIILTSLFLVSEANRRRKTKQ